MHPSPDKRDLQIHHILSIEDGSLPENVSKDEVALQAVKTVTAMAGNVRKQYCVVVPVHSGAMRGGSLVQGFELDQAGKAISKNVPRFVLEGVIGDIGAGE